MLPTRDKLRAVCHDLKMRNLSGLDPVRLPDFMSRIAKLPSPERILSMADNDLSELRGRLDKLLFDIDRSDKTRTLDYATRHRVDKKMPPYRPPLFAKGWYGRYKGASHAAAGVSPEG